MLAPPSIAGFARAAEIAAANAVLLEWPDVVPVSEAAARYRYLDNPGGGYSGPWLNDKAPHLVRPMDCLSSGLYSLVVVQGPAQSGKSEVPNNWLLQAILCDQADFMWLQTTKEMMRSYVLGRIDKMIDNCPELRARLRPDRAADATFSKFFRGMGVWFIWPVKELMQSTPAARFVIDDFDRLKDSIDGEGDALSLLQARQTTFEGSEVGYVGSSPAKGPKRGIEALRKTGTDERFTWKCPQCGHWFEPHFDRDLQFERTDDPADARRTAFVLCPSGNGCVIPPIHKDEMRLGGKWIGPAQTINAAGEVEGELAPNTIASFRIDGLFGFSSWGRLAELWRRAEIDLETLHDEEKFRTFWNTRGGKNYTSQLDSETPLTVDDFGADRCDDYALGTVPPGVVVLTAAVDVQGGDRAFEVEVKGWGEGNESWLIDRFPILALDDGRTKIQPGRYAEHWRPILEHVLWKKYPLATDPSVSVPILNVAIDTGGVEGVTENAKKFWHSARGLGVPSTSLMLIKGGTNLKAEVVTGPTYLEKSAAGKPNKAGAVLWILNVHRIKNILDNRLRREEPGPGFHHFPADTPAEVFDELVAEERIDGLWQKVAGNNETWDLEVYNYAAFRLHAGERIDMAWVPAWARAPHQDGAPVPTAPASDGRRRSGRARPRIRTR